MKKEQAHRLAQEVILEAESNIDSHVQNALAMILSKITSNASDGLFSASIATEKLTSAIKVLSVRDKVIIKLSHVLRSEYGYQVSLDSNSIPIKLRVEW
jgi:hypothetical protein